MTVNSGRIAVLGLIVAALMAAAPGPAVRAQSSAIQQPLAGPQRGWTCPMHREVLEHDEGTCPICQMALEPTVVETVWTCPLHAVIMEDAPGKCRIDQRDLVATTVEVKWACPRHPDETALEPGTCKIDGLPLERSRSMRPHENHNPQHGGQFFMAPDNWHHVEGTYPEPGLLRIFLYDNYSQPLDARTFSGRLVLEEAYDQASGGMKELKTAPLAPAADGAYFEARVEAPSLPVEIATKITFAAGQAESRFDFVFAEHSREPDRTAETAAAAFAELSGAAFNPLARLVIPDAPDALVSEILLRGETVKQLVERGAFTEIFLPALEAKELGLALEERLASLAEPARTDVTLAIKQLVRAAYLLDWYGDLGNRAQVEEAHALFESAVARIGTGYGR